MESSTLNKVLAVLGWITLLAGVAMSSYGIYAAVQQSVYLASKHTEAVILFESAPGPFIVAISLYIAGGALFLWIASCLLRPRRKGS